jgi:signal transduction histidine kinase
MLDRRTSVAALLASFVTTTTAASQQELGSNPAMSPVSIVLFVTILYAMLSIGAWALGRWVQHSRLAMDQLEERRRRAATEAVTAERQRIARELHDIVSHSVSVIVLQAAGARRVLASDRARAEKALAHIEGIGKESMVELRRLLGVLHDGVSADDERELGPQPGLTDLTSLVEGVRAGGLAVQMTVNGTPARLDPSVDLSAYRIVQEALTNSIKHGGGRAHATVTLDWTTELQIEVTDDGGPAADPALSTGHGLLGLKERARAVGGHLEAGPLERGGFRIRASLPLAQSGRPDARESALHQG